MTRTPAEIREAIAEARAELGEHLRALSDPPHCGDETMAARAKPKRTEAKSEKKPPKSHAKAKSKPKKASPARVAKGAAATAGHALDTIAAGAVVGAVKAVAHAIEEKESRSPLRKPASTIEVLSEMAPDAASGAIAGAAQTIMPKESKREVPEKKREVPEKVKPKGRSTKGGAARKK